MANLSTPVTSSMPAGEEEEEEEEEVGVMEEKEKWGESIRRARHLSATRVKRPAHCSSGDTPQDVSRHFTD